MEMIKKMKARLGALERRRAAMIEAVEQIEATGDPISHIRTANGVLIIQSQNALRRFVSAPNLANWDGIRHRLVCPSLTTQEACHVFLPEVGVGQGLDHHPTPDQLLNVIERAARYEVKSLNSRIAKLSSDIHDLERGESDLLDPSKGNSADLIIA